MFVSYQFEKKIPLAGPASGRDKIAPQSIRSARGRGRRGGALGANCNVGTGAAAVMHTQAHICFRLEQDADRCWGEMRRR